jgi:hypothetical protein
MPSVPEVWIESMHNLHCPTCDDRLIERAGRFDVLGKSTPTYVGDGNRPPVCPNGHAQPPVEQLYVYRDEKGYPPEAPFSEVPPPA